MSFSREVEDLIADFRNLPRAVSDSSLGTPTRLSNVLVVLSERHALNRETPERILVDNWSSIFGPQYASRCHPVKIVDNGATLIIAAAHPVLRSNLAMNTRAYLAKINRLPLCANIRRITTRAG